MDVQIREIRQKFLYVFVEIYTVTFGGFCDCWAHVRRYWLKADSKNGQVDVNRGSFLD